MLNLRYSYDFVGRLIQIEERNGSAWRRLKEFRYARSNNGSDKRAGKLVTAKRWNWTQIVAPLNMINGGDLPVTVSDRFWYEADGGRISKKVTSVNVASNHQSWESSYAYDQLGNLSSVSYPQGLSWPLSADEPARTVTMEYDQGFLAEIPDYVDDMKYQLGGDLLNEIVFADNDTDDDNNVVWRQNFDTDTHLARPFNISVLQGSQVLTDLGEHHYDSAGNLRQIGPLQYRYDNFQRLKSESVGAAARFTANYDAYGNITQLNHAGTVQNTATSLTTNRLTGLSADYDPNGNLTDIVLGGSAVRYAWDGLSKMKSQQTTSTSHVYLYDANDERLLTYTCPANVCGANTEKWRWTPRGLSGEVLRISEGDGGATTYRWREDYVFAGSRAVARVLPIGINYLHADHLGSTRLITARGSGAVVAQHSFYPYGKQIEAKTPREVALKFTGHERDEAGVETQSLDYMHARYCSPELGRFWSVDPIKSAMTKAPQSWNKYGYAKANPVKYVDPNGEAILLATAALGAIEGAGFQVAINVISGDPLFKNVGREAVVGGALGATGVGLANVGRKGFQAIKAARIASGLRSGKLVWSPSGPVKRAVLARAASSGGRTRRVVTNLDSAPSPGKGLSVATGDAADALASQARENGSLFEANIPEALIRELRDAGLADFRSTIMRGQLGEEIRFSPQDYEFIQEFFEKFPIKEYCYEMVLSRFSCSFLSGRRTWFRHTSEPGLRGEAVFRACLQSC